MEKKLSQLESAFIEKSTRIFRIAENHASDLEAQAKAIRADAQADMVAALEMCGVPPHATVTKTEDGAIAEWGEVSGDE